MTDFSVRPTSPAFSLGRLWKRRKNTLTVLAALAGFAWLSHVILAGQGAETVRFRVDLSPLRTISPVLQAHVAGAIASFLIGAVLLMGVKGRTFHRTLGYAWVATMTATAVSSLFITGLNGNSYSLIHLLSGWSLIVLPMGLAAARRRDIAKHRKEMTGLFFGGMLIAGLFTFLPGRLMWQLFFAV